MSVSALKKKKAYVVKTRQSNYRASMKLEGIAFASFNEIIPDISSEESESANNYKSRILAKYKKADSKQVLDGG